MLELIGSPRGRRQHSQKRHKSEVSRRRTHEVFDETELVVVVAAEEEAVVVEAAALFGLGTTPVGTMLHTSGEEEVELTLLDDDEEEEGATLLEAVVETTAARA